MSGGIAQLVAVGAQDVHLVGNPEISFFRSQYKRHTNFASFLDRQVVQGSQGNNTMVSVRLERKADLLGGLYLAAVSGNASIYPGSIWEGIYDKVELLIGGQVIDTLYPAWNDFLWHDLLAQTPAQAQGIITPFVGNKAWNPLHFWFCENAQCALPLVALQYHDVELRIYLADEFSTALGANGKLECYARYYSLDDAEREWFASKPHELLITQSQMISPTGTSVLDLNFSHPVKFIAADAIADYSGAVANMNDSAAGDAFNSKTTRIRLQINGTDVNKGFFSNPHFTDASRYYCAPQGNTLKPGMANDTTRALYQVITFLYPFCLDTSKYQPTGTLNFSRLDNARFIADGDDGFDSQCFACNYNILKVQNGMGGLMYAN